MNGVLGGAAALACCALSPGQATAGIHPHADVPYRYEVTETRSADGVMRRFTARRTVVFHPVESGWDAVVTLESVDTDAAGAVGATFRTVTGALRHYPLRFRIDAAGRVAEVLGADAAVALIADALERSAGTATRADARALAAPLRDAPPARKAAMLLSILRPLLLADLAGRAPGTRAITLPSRPPLPPGDTLSGTETVARRPDGVMTVETHAAGLLAAAPPPETPGATYATGPAPGITVDATRLIDPATGLLIEARETSDTTLPGNDPPRHATIETVIRFGLDTP